MCDVMFAKMGDQASGEMFEGRKDSPSESQSMGVVSSAVMTLKSTPTLKLLAR